MVGWIGGWMSGSVGGWVGDGWMGEWMDEKVEGGVSPPFSQSSTIWADSAPEHLALTSLSSSLSLLVSLPILTALDLAGFGPRRQAERPSHWLV